MHPAAIGPFTIERELGRGGMGEVFLARDTRLDRQVAIKALPAHLAHDPDRLARFQREAKVLASLSHPCIGAIYGLEESGGRQYLVLEFIEGETLADRLAKGPIPVEEALPLARQIAEALEIAHDKGVIHRDLKPGNVMVTPEGVAKVLDFGLARSTEGSPSSGGMPAAPESPTLTSPAPIHSPTIPGVIMGTAGYMSPEQARGKPVDKRSDIFSFGCVLYEMLTGEMPFRGETVADAIGATLHKESDLALLPPTTPRRVRDLIARCLAKDKRNRLHDAGDARLELEHAISGREWASDAGPAANPRRRPLATVGAATALALLAGAVGWLAASQLRAPAPVAATQSFHVSTAIPSKPAFQSFAGISPDARFVVYTAWPELEPDSTTPGGIIVVRRLDRDETTVIDGTEGAANAALSPDGRWMAYTCAKDVARTKFTIKRVPLDNGRPSGRPEIVCDIRQGMGANVGWASDQQIVFANDLVSEMYVVPASGGEPRSVFHGDLSKGIDGFTSLAPLVAGQSILATRFTLSNGGIKADTEAVDLATGERTLLLEDAAFARLVDDPVRGSTFLLAARLGQAGLLAVPLDRTTLRTNGNPVTVWTGSADAGFGYSKNGTLALPGTSLDFSDRRIARMDEKGQPQAIPGATRAYSQIAVSPDGGRVLAGLEVTDPEAFSNFELWVQDLTRRTMTRLPIQGQPVAMLWSRDGQRIAYGTFSNDGFAVWELRADGVGDATKIFDAPLAQLAVAMPSAWSPDGRVLAIVQQDTKTNTADVLMLEKAADGELWKATPYLNSPADEHALQFSPDGKWVVFCSVASGRHELYAQRFTGAASGAQDAKSGRIQVSSGGHDGSCWWSPDGKEIRYIDGDRQVVSVEVQTEPSFSASMPRVLYSLKDVKTRGFSWTPEGNLMVVLQGQNEQTSRIDVVVNFAEEIHAKMGAAK
jgi:eukaryotic-like serine/threonine-protein kinase